MFGKRIKQLRKSKTSLTQLDMAKYLGVAKTTYASYEQGKRMPDPSIQKMIADYFEVSLDYLHGRDEKKNLANNKVMTIAAHIDDDTSDEEMEEIIDYITYIKNKHKKK